MLAILGAVVACAVIMWVGLIVIRAIGRGMPEPPPAGELRRIALNYRCSICGAELKMTRANDELPEPPRHCLEDMDLVTPVE